MANGSYLEMALTQLVINLRYSLMSFSLSQKLSRKESWFHRYLVAFGVTDEIFAVSINQKGKTSAFFNYGAMAVAIPGWTFGTLFGALLGNVLPAFLISALSLAIYGMFIAIIIPPAKTNTKLLCVIIASMLLSTAFYILPGLKEVSSGFVIIICTVLVSAVAAKLAPISEEAEHE